MIPQRFWDKVDLNGPMLSPYLGPCWLWLASRTHDGYAQWMLHEGKKTMGHRWLHEEIHGPIADDLTLDHLCRVRRCVNPAHLERVTNRENILRGYGPSARNARKTHCINGHELTPENTYLPPNEEARYCKICRKAAAKRLNERLLAKRAAARALRR